MPPALTWGTGMANESKQDIKQYIEGAEYPTTRQNLTTFAENNGAPVEVVHRLNQLPSNADYSGPEEVVEELEARLEVLCGASFAKTVL